MSHISTESEAAGEIVNIAVKGATEAVTLAGRGALNLAAFLLAALKEQQRTKGKVNLRAFRAKSTTVFTLKNIEELRLFHRAAKKYGILFSTVVDKKHLDGQCDVIVPIEDAARVNRIIDGYRLSTVKMELPEEHAETAKGGNRTNAPAQEESGFPIRERTAPKNEKADAELLSAFDEALNPMEAQTEKKNPSAPFSRNKSNSSREAILTGNSERPSVRSALSEAMAEAKRIGAQQHTSPVLEPEGTFTLKVKKGR